MTDALTGDYAFENGIKMLIGKEFGGVANGFAVRWEAKNFRPSKFSDKFLGEVKDQATGRAAKIAEIYFRGKYLCDVSEAMHPTEVVRKIEESLAILITKGGVGK